MQELAGINGRTFVDNPQLDVLDFYRLFNAIVQIRNATILHPIDHDDPQYRERQILRKG